MHSRQLQYIVESFTHSRKLYCTAEKFCCIGEKSILRQKLEKSSFYSKNWRKDSLAAEIGEKSVRGKNWRKVPSAVEIEDKLTLQRLPLDLDSTFAHNLVAAKWYFEAYSTERQARLPS